VKERRRVHFDFLDSRAPTTCLLRVLAEGDHARDVSNELGEGSSRVVMELREGGSGRRGIVGRRGRRGGDGRGGIRDSRVSSSRVDLCSERERSCQSENVHHQFQGQFSIRSRSLSPKILS